MHFWESSTHSRGNLRILWTSGSSNDNSFIYHDVNCHFQRHTLYYVRPYNLPLNLFLFFCVYTACRSMIKIIVREIVHYTVSVLTLLQESRYLIRFICFYGCCISYNLDVFFITKVFQFDLSCNTLNLQSETYI